MSSFGANGFSVKPFLWLWYNRFFSTARFGYYDQTSAFIRFLSISILSNCSSRKFKNSTNPQVAAKGGFDMLTGSTISKTPCRSSCEFSSYIQWTW
jgi:hypothetical protein